MSTSYGLNPGMELDVHKSTLRAPPVRERPEAGILVCHPCNGRSLQDDSFDPRFAKGLRQE